MLWQTGSAATCLDITKENFYVKDTRNIILMSHIYKPSCLHIL